MLTEVAFKLRNSYVKHKDRLEEALGEIEKVKAKLISWLGNHPLRRA